MPKKLELTPVHSTSSYKVEIDLDKYTGEGASCTVFLGKRNDLDVIVKKMSSKDLDKIEREQVRYNELTNISRNHTLVAFDIYTDDEGFLYKIQQMNDGKIWDIESFPAKNYTLYDSLLIIKSLLTVVAAYHKNDILLIDISPDNIFIQENEHRVMLFDLDASINMNELRKLKRISSKQFFAPWEVTSFKKNKLGTWSDLYMVANCLYYRLFEQTFDISNHRYLSDINFSQTGKFKDHNQIFGEQKALLIAFFQKALRFEPQDRFQTASQMIEEIDKLIELSKSTYFQVENELPYFKDPYFQGRQAELKFIDDYLENSPIFICGESGAGKTSLAIKYAIEKHEKEESKVIYIPFEDSLFNTICNIDVTNFDYTKKRYEH